MGTKQSARWLAQPAWAAGVQAIGIVVGGGLVLRVLHGILPLLVIWQLWFIGVLPGALLWLAVRWWVPAGSHWRQFWIELGTISGWALILSIVMIAMSANLDPSTKITLTQGQVRAFEDGLIGVVLLVSLLFRFGARLVHRLLRLRQQYFLWSLTYAHLKAIGLAVLTLIALVTLLDLLFLPAFILKLLPNTVFLLGTGALALLLLLPPSALFSYLVARRLTGRLQALTQTTDALRRGDLAQRVPVVGADEVARLQQNFNAMAADLERAQAELRRERDTVAALLQARRELMAAVSHDLRTPVATMRSYLESLRARYQTQPQDLTQQDLTVVHQESLHLQRLVDDLFSLARAEVGKLPLHCEPTALATLIARIVAATAPYAWEASRVTVAAQLPPDLPPAQIDPQRLEQILHNLLQNAVRHTPPGGLVTITASVEERHITLHVRDTGTGIAPDVLPHIFDRFYQGNGTGAQVGGAGLGLALVREWTEAMGGRVVVTSHMGEGSCFSITAPLATVPVAT